ncbi:conserved hypothetical protein [Neospora caninum Liverpool]|uniref:Uncharacterized protein n=1 Tax=Neospora caninum (strain Liverpool) TaxID=572307 RepID=F0VKE9_NEOCL|nr:conserved hypothetical protein [Neospora caninum Liverpool]CBZ54550.1 conserved hypothetical protein [Neospora caninum Liverpool]|eukprot:XP_003884580.1 conserved hypothetical protein [Neospora caninum Liverpool]
MDSGSQSAGGGASASGKGTPRAQTNAATATPQTSQGASGGSVAERGTSASPPLHHFSTTVISSTPRADARGPGRAATFAAFASHAHVGTAIPAAGANSCDGGKPYQTAGPGCSHSEARPVETLPRTVASAGSGKAHLEYIAPQTIPLTPTVCSDKLEAKQAFFSSHQPWTPASQTVQSLPSQFVGGMPVENAKGQTAYTPEKETLYYSAAPRIVGYRKVGPLGEKDVQVLSSGLVASQTGPQKGYLGELNVVDHAGAGSTSKVTYAPLPLLERLQLGQMPGSPHARRGESRCDSLFPLIRIRGRSGGPCEISSIDLKRFLKRVQLAASTYCEDMRRLVQMPFDTVPPTFGNGAAFGKTALYQQVAAPHCPNCGYGTLVWTAAPFSEAGGVPMSSSPAVFDAKENCVDRLARWQCSLCGDIAAAVDEELLECTNIGGCTEAGDRVDQFVAEGIHGLAEYLRSSCAGWLRGSQRMVEGYPLYEPDPALCRKERPTSLTGNMCVDQLNAFLDACLVEPHKMEEAPPPPQIPDTQQTGNWLVDKANAMLDRLCEQMAALSWTSVVRARKSVLSAINGLAKSDAEEHVGPAERQTGGVVECCLQQDRFVSDREEARTGVYATSLPPQQYVDLPNFVAPEKVTVIDGSVSKVAPLSPTLYRKVEKPEIVTYDSKRAAWIGMELKLSTDAVAEKNALP